MEKVVLLCSEIVRECDTFGKWQNFLAAAAVAINKEERMETWHKLDSSGRAPCIRYYIHTYVCMR